MSRRQDKRLAQGVLFSGLGQLLAATGGLINQYNQREANQLKQASLERLQKQSFEYQKQRDTKNDSFKQQQLTNQQAQTEANNSFKQQQLTQQGEQHKTSQANTKAIANMQNDTAQDRLTLTEQQGFINGVKNSLNRFDSQIANLQEQVAASELSPEQAQKMAQPILVEKMKFKMQLADNNAEQLANSELAYLVDESQTLKTQLAKAATPVNPATPENPNNARQTIAQQMSALETEQAQRPPALSFDEFKLSQGAEQQVTQAKAPTGGGLFGNGAASDLVPMEKQYQLYQQEYANGTDRFAQQQQSLSQSQKINNIASLNQKVKAGTATQQDIALLQSLMGKSTQYSMPMPGANL